MKANNADTKGKVASQISTSKHFYDVTAHKFIEENGYDMQLRYICGLSADMDELLTQKGQNDAKCYFDEMIFKIQNGIFLYKEPAKACEKRVYEKTLTAAEKSDAKDIAIVTSCAVQDINLRNMIDDFKAVLPYNAREINLTQFPFAGGCLGCMECAVSGKCCHNDILFTMRQMSGVNYIEEL
ncbi:MAG: hypothetical protein GXZ14_08190 [Ruminococcaceae bacterium]|nr:hypothetical protein [Oscillospiraceae bacterium]